MLNCEPPDAGYVMQPEDFRWIPGALDGLAALRRAGIRLSVATNQSGVGRGLMGQGQLDAVHARMLAEAAAGGGTLDALLVCPHSPEAGCACRKPAPGLIETAMAQSGILASETLVVGDDGRDIEAAARAGVAAALVRTGKGRQTETRMRRPIPVFDDLAALAQAVVAGKLEAR